MAYYIISFVPDAMTEFLERIDILDAAIWIKDKKQLADVISSPGDDPFFFVHLSEDRTAIDDLVLTIREKMSVAKILYVIEESNAHDLKEHQLSPVGGDAYIPVHIRPNNLAPMLEALSPQVVNERGNRLENTAMGSVNISAQKSLEEFKNHPKSKQLDAIFAEAINATAKKPLWQSTQDFAPPELPDDEPEIEEIAEEIEDEVEEEVEELEADEDQEEVEEEEETEDDGEEEADEDLPPELEDFEEIEEAGVEMSSDKDQELSLDDLGDLELGAEGEPEVAPPDEAGLDLDLGDDVGFDLGSADDAPEEAPADSGMDLDLDEGFSLDDSTSEDAAVEENVSLSEDEDLGFSLDVGEDSDTPDLPDLGDDLSLSDDSSDDDVGLSLGEDDDLGLSLGGDDDDLGLSLSDDDLDGGADIDLSEDAKEKLKEIDAIMDLDASQIAITVDLGASDDSDDLGFSLDAGGDDDSDLETSLVSDDLNLDSINFSSEDDEIEEIAVAAPVKEEKAKKKPAAKESRDTYEGNIGQDLKEISGAYSGEMERMQATISNLRSDREELMAKIQKLEEDKVFQSRHNLTIRAELDEKKIELSIIRKKLNDEITELKDRLKLFEEKKLILEEKNRILAVELDKAAQKNKIDVKKVQLRERELEQKLELLKADSETQIRHRDLKILELKRKLDAMEFDIESISVQEKRSVESRFELEDKLDKAIKTLRNAITVLEDESEKSGALEALKKNIDM